MKYRNYIFDLYGTLIDLSTDEVGISLWRRLAEYYSCYGADYTAAELRKSYCSAVRLEEERIAAMTGYTYPEVKLEKVFLELLKNAPKKHPTDYTITDENVWADFISNTFRIQSRKYIRLFPGVADTLKALRSAGCRVILLSNAQRVFTMPEIEAAGIASAFDAMYISSDYLVKKPQKEFMELVLEKENISAEDSVMVGNDFMCDMEMARNCKVDGIYFNSAGYSPEQLKEYNTMNARIISAIPEILQ